LREVEGLTDFSEYEKIEIRIFESIKFAEIENLRDIASKFEVRRVPLF
jgi:hypothetical protein